MSNKNNFQIYDDLVAKKKAISVIGLGYVGLPIALEFAKHFKVIGFDISQAQIAQATKKHAHLKNVEF